MCRPIRISACGRSDIDNLKVRKADEGDMVPLGTLVDDHAASPGPSLISLYNLYPCRDHRSACRRQRHSVPGEALALMEQIADADAAAGRRLSSGRRCPIRRRRSASRSTSSSPSPCCWSISCSPASTRAGMRRFRVILAVPLALVGPVLALKALGVANNLYTPDRPHAC